MEFTTHNEVKSGVYVGMHINMDSDKAYIGNDLRMCKDVIAGNSFGCKTCLVRGMAVSEKGSEIKNHFFLRQDMTGIISSAKNKNIRIIFRGK